MKLYIKKLSFVFLALTLLLGACEDEESITVITPEAAFVLQQPGISNIFLNFGLLTNPAMNITWKDDLTGSSSYDVELSLEDTFANPVVLGNATGRSFSYNVENLNNAIINAGATNFRDVAVYVRVNAGSEISNSILFLVTTYPTNPAQMTSPANGDSFVLSIGSLDAVAMTVNWEDPVLTSTLSIDVEYTIEAATAGTDFAAVSPLGIVPNNTSLEITHSDLNVIALGLGIAVDVAGDVDMRIVAKIVNESGNILTRTSDVITVSITPFNFTFPYLYLVGDATTPGWSPNNNNTAVFRSQNTPNSYHYTGYFMAGAFKMLETTDWQPQWGTNDGTTLAVNPGGGSDPGTFNVSAAGYYTYTFSPLAAGAAFTVAPYDASGAPTYARIGLIGQAIGGWGDADEIDLIQDPNNPHLWYANGITFTNGEEFLIRPNDDWGNGLWRYTGSDELFGQGRFDTGGDNFPFNATSGSYDFWFNDLDGSYVIIPN
tara:strand:+ start:1967 stop:3430 length:1464 start_codon:yes stop_codon:yes gene_type:complete